MKSEIAHQRPSLRPPQFGLRTLLIAVAACCVVLAILRLGWLSPIGIGVIAFLAVSLFLHVAGNAIGTRLREIGDQPNPERSLDATAAIRHAQPEDFAPVTQLGQRQSLGWTIVVAVSVGLASGAIGGGLWTFAMSHGRAGLPDIAIGIVAFAVLGGIAAFAMASFAQVLAGALWQAMKTPPRTGSSESAMK